MIFTTFVQWKGTNLCMDMNCPACGGDSHFDGFFAYVVERPHCGGRFKMPTDLALVPATAEDGEMPFLRGEP